MRSLSSLTLALSLVCAAIATACSSVPTSGPSKSEVAQSSASTDELGIQIVDVNDAVARRLLADRSAGDFAKTLGELPMRQQRLGAGDVVEVSIWEAPPAMLFGASPTDTRSGGASNARVTVLPDQMIDAAGDINVPFAGEIKVTGQTLDEVGRAITDRLRGKANQPQTLVRLVQNSTSYVTIVGDVTSSKRMPLTPSGERLLDALASAGGVRQPVDKTTVQVTRGDQVQSLPLETIIRDPRQNVPLRSGDVVTALYQPFSFTALGATGKNDEVNFEAQGITLAQALARVGGLTDSRSDARGVFIFRFEDASALTWPQQPVRTTPNGKVPVVYRIDLKDPRSFFIAQTFMMNNKDVLYVSNAPIAELQKFLNVVFSVAYPVMSTITTFR
ncbi:polysaccharide export protein [Paraburkholderia sp. RP-4-7]|uniref:Polysaccharide export protein n=1 Tax=Paraburkholderia polaris TaxID=2728848 RepID=A0A848IHT1_9BURK|nr:polysaccharide biosynthesis/export family protein [Paraburkholderia polaris]NMM01948.1 polysaccharide export protein [Paraburkholderia polaris]